jgi:hypothetical protein
VAAGIKGRHSVLRDLVQSSADPTISMTTDDVSNSVTNEDDVDCATLEHGRPTSKNNVQRFHPTEELLSDDVTSSDNSASAANGQRQHDNGNPNWHPADVRQGDIHDLATMKCSSILTPYSDMSMYNGNEGVPHERRSISTGFTGGRPSPKMRMSRQLRR